MSWPTSSLQQGLPPNVTPGWNDPPPIGGGSTPTNGRLDRRKRLVDPSISGGTNGISGAAIQQQPLHANGYAQHQGMPVSGGNAPQQIYQHQIDATVNVHSGHAPPNQGFRLTPQLLAGESTAAFINITSSTIETQDIFPNKDITEAILNTSILPHISNINILEQSDILLTPPLTPTPPNSTEEGNAISVPLWELNSALAATVSSKRDPMGPATLAQPQVSSDQSEQPQSFRPIYNAFNVHGSKNNSDVFSTRTAIMIPVQKTMAWSSSASTEGDVSPVLGVPSATPLSGSASPPTTSIMMAAPLERDPSSLIYSAPNFVAEDSSQRPPFSSIDTTSFRVPKKAAGDVSLSGSQCVAFLTKASMRLAPVKCEGVQLRLASLKDQVGRDAISEGCLKKLNFVVDAVDREQYDEAWNFFEQLQLNFPNEMGAWTQGLRLLISELRRSPARSGSAGSHSRSQ